MQRQDDQKSGVLGKTRSIFEMIKFSHTIFALPFAILSAVLAWRTPLTSGGAGAAATQVEFSFLHLLGILVCMVGARSAAMAFNRLVDRKIDAGNPRTASRHLPSGQLSVGSVIVFIVVSSLVFIAGTTMFWPNWLPLALSVPVLLWLMGYSYAKRFTALAHYWLGGALMLAPVCVWIALRGQQVVADPWDLVPAFLLGLGVFFWVGGFDIIYACQDFQFDTDAKLSSIPVRLGIGGALRLAAWSHLVAWLCFVAIPWVPWGPTIGLAWAYGCGTVAMGGLLCYQHLIVDAKDLSRVNVAFFNVNAVISVGLLVVGCIDLLALGT